MILAVDVGEDRLSYGFHLILQAIRAKYGNIVQYVKNEDLDKVNVSSYKIVLFSFMFIENYLHVNSLLKKLNLTEQIKIAGGQPITENPEPVKYFFDILVLGEGETAIIDVLDIVFRYNFDKQCLGEVNTIDCVIVPSMGVKAVKIRKENIDNAVRLAGNYERGDGSTSEILFEYERGCKRRCHFCSYGNMQYPYRQISTELFREKMSEQSKLIHGGMRILPMQVNFFHYDIDDLNIMHHYGKMVNYTSACLNDFYRYKEHIQYMRNLYLRIGIEDFTEEGRKRIGKPVSDNEIINLPLFFKGIGKRVKLFFISHLPLQSAESVQSFEAVLNEMSKRISNTWIVEIYVTTLTYKLNCKKMLKYEKIYNDGVVRAINNLQRRYNNKLQIKVFKNQSRAVFELYNALSLSDSNLYEVLNNITGKEKKEVIVDRISKKINLDDLFSAYDENRILPNYYVNYG